jgi:methionyl-tRNA formyltransferase
MNILCIGYRGWALDIYDTLAKNYHTGDVFIIRNKEDYSDEIVRNYNPDVILFYGWSWIVNKTIIEDYKCIMLHPSKLPKYRGGSPIQNQIISGETESAVTLFVMTSELDSGPILFQEKFSLSGHMEDIFSRIIKLGYKGTMKFLKSSSVGVEQKEDDATYCKRRDESQSEITLDELTNKSAEYLYNKIRMLEDPYPNAFIMSKNGRKILIKKAELSD